MQELDEAMNRLQEATAQMDRAFAEADRLFARVDPTILDTDAAMHTVSFKAKSVTDRLRVAKKFATMAFAIIFRGRTNLKFRTHCAA